MKTFFFLFCSALTLQIHLAIDFTPSGGEPGTTGLSSTKIDMDDWKGPALYMTHPNGVFRITQTISNNMYDRCFNMNAMGPISPTTQLQLVGDGTKPNMFGTLQGDGTHYFKRTGTCRSSDDGHSTKFLVHGFEDKTLGGANLTFTDLSFADLGRKNRYGPILATYGAILNFERCDFLRINQGNNGGSYWNAVKYRYNSRGTIKDCRFQQIMWNTPVELESNSQVKIINSVFENNQLCVAGNHGCQNKGVIFVTEQSRLEMYGTLVTNHNSSDEDPTKLDPAQILVGVVVIDGQSYAEFHHSNFTNNKRKNGAALQIINGATGFASNCLFENNVAVNGGGAFSLSGDTTNFALNQVTFRQNTAGARGGAILATEGHLTLDGGTNFENNVCSGDGGAVHLSNNVVVEMGDVTFKNNRIVLGSLPSYIEQGFSIKSVASLVATINNEASSWVSSEKRCNEYGRRLCTLSEICDNSVTTKKSITSSQSWIPVLVKITPAQPSWFNLNDNTAVSSCAGISTANSVARNDDIVHCCSDTLPSTATGNLALNKPAIQVGVYYWNSANDPTGSIAAGKGVDGDIETGVGVSLWKADDIPVHFNYHKGDRTINHEYTRGIYRAWWRVDLLEDTFIQKVRIRQGKSMDTKCAQRTDYELKMGLGHHTHHSDVPTAERVFRIDYFPGEPYSEITVITAVVTRYIYLTGRIDMINTIGGDSAWTYSGENQRFRLNPCFTELEAYPPTGHGGAIYAVAGTQIIFDPEKNAQVLSNQALVGGGLYIAKGAVLLNSPNVVQGNAAMIQGGGLFSEAAVTIRDPIRWGKNSAPDGMNGDIFIAKSHFQMRIVCPMGQYFNKKNANLTVASLDDPFALCQQCDPGQFADNVGALKCLACPIGQSQPEKGGSECNACEIGRYQNKKAASECVICEAGKSSILNGSTSCQACEAGLFSNTSGVACQPCVPGQHRASGNKNATACVNCPIGFSQSDPGQASCIPCSPGEFNDVAGAVGCKLCLNTTYFGEKGRNSSCIDCPTGWSSEDGSAKCVACGAGTFGTGCTNCVPGQYRASSNKNATACVNCPIGFSQSDPGQASCTKCSPGEFSNVSGVGTCESCAENTYYGDKGRNSTCVDCPTGWSSSKGSAKCIVCGAGTFGDGCQNCPLGFARTAVEDATQCQRCNPGFTTTTPGAAICSGCDLGKYGTDHGTCTHCPSDRYQDTRGQQTCKTCAVQGEEPNAKQTACAKPPEDLTIPTMQLMSIAPSSKRLVASTVAQRRLLNDKTKADGSGALLTVQITKRPLGSPNLLEDGDKLEIYTSTRPDFSGSDVVVLDQNEFEVVPTESTSSAIVVSIHLSAIVDNSADPEGEDVSSGNTVWHNQLYFQLRVLKEGTNAGAFSTRNGPWETANKCSDSEYLSVYEGDRFNSDGTESSSAPHTLISATDTTVTTPKCLPCPNGGNCKGKKIFDEVNNLAGFQQLSWDPRAFGKCPYPASCPVGNSIVMKYSNSSVTNGLQNKTKMLVSCLEGHTGNLCSQCVRGWTIPIGSENTTCVKCPSSEANVASLAGLVFVGIVIVAFLVWDSLDGIKLIIASAERAKEATNAEEARIAAAQAQMPFHSVGIRIISSYLQVAGLLTNFQVTLPPSVEALLVVESGASGIGGQVIAFSCLMPNTRGADLFFLKQLMCCLVIPAGLCVLIVLFWSVYGICCSRLVKTKTNNPNKATGKNMVTLRDKMQGSLVILYYMMIPSILNSVTSMLQCTRYGEDDRSTNNLINYQIQPKVLLDAELSIVCYEKDHVQMVLSIALPGILLFLVLVPLTLLLSMRYHARKKELFAQNKNFNPRVSYRFGFLFLGYEGTTYAWELVVMMRKAAFVVVSGVLRGYGPIAQVIGAVCILICALSLHLQYRPYEVQGHDTMESFSLHSGLVILLIVLLSTAVSTEDIEKSNRLGTASTVITIVGVFGATIVFFLVSNWLILRNSHDNTGLLGSLARRLTRRATAQQITATISSRPQRMQRTLSKQKTIDMVDRAVSHDKAVKIQSKSSQSRAKALSAIKAREKKADARVRQRLLERRNKKKKGARHKQNLNQQVKQWQVEPTNHAAEVNIVKQQLVKKIKTQERLRNVFSKLDLDGNGMLSKNEFIRMIALLLKKKLNRNLMICCWEAAWDLRKHGDADEMDAGTVAHWLGMEDE